ncbi:hypothetical protein [Demequina sp. NBRC 110052]|uniref:hypothetical protein n=1 Tax=Demequina sp. NBRC 110052 TaxID=1570341 RepID=UPI000A00BBFC|nr:hypothetical protein [Demequina sp. NBRC 110052]
MTVARALELIERADRTWELRAQAMLLDESIALAREANDAGVEYAARLRAVPNAAMRFEVSEAVTHLAWCVARHDDDPASHPRRLDRTEDVLYLEDWALRQLALSDALAPARVTELIDAHERRLAGTGPHAVSVLRALHAWALGDADAAAAHIDEAILTPGDAMTHCIRCTRDIAAQIADSAGRVEAAIAACDDYAAEPCVDADQPASALSRGLFAWTAMGRMPDAEAAYASASRRVQARPTTPEVLGRLARYALATGRFDEALKHVESALPWAMGSALATHLRMSALRELAAVLSGLEAAGLGSEPLSTAGDPRVGRLLPTGHQPWTVAQAAPRAVAAARHLAERFDARGGTTFHVEHLERTLTGVA